MNIKPIKDRVLVDPTPVDEKTAGGIILSSNHLKDRTYARAKVLAVGAGKPEEPMVVKEGDSVIYSVHAGVELQVEGKMCRMIRQSDIAVIL